MIYLASPYSGPWWLRWWRWFRVCRAVAELMRDGHLVYSPIAHSHAIALFGKLPGGWEFWKKFDKATIAACAEVWVLMLPGWGQSKGVMAELKIAREMGKVVRYLCPGTMDWVGPDELWPLEGSVSCCDCSHILTVEEVLYYGGRCEACEAGTVRLLRK